MAQTIDYASPPARPRGVVALAVAVFCCASGALIMNPLLMIAATGEFQGARQVVAMVKANPQTFLRPIPPDVLATLTPPTPVPYILAMMSLMMALTCAGLLIVSGVLVLTRPWKAMWWLDLYHRCKWTTVVVATVSLFWLLLLCDKVVGECTRHHAVGSEDRYVVLLVILGVGLAVPVWLRGHLRKRPTLAAYVGGAVEAKAVLPADKTPWE